MRNYKPGSKLAQMQKETKTCEDLMETFCLDPSVETYQRIARCQSIIRREFFATWALMVPYRYKVDLNKIINTDRNEVTMVTGNEKIHGKTPNRDNTAPSLDDGFRADIVYRALMTRLESDPNMKTAQLILHCFFATGRFTAIEKYYECMGDERVPRASRIQLCEKYKEIKSLYIDKIAELSQKNPEHFSNLGIPKRHVDFSYFEQYQKEYERAKGTK